MTEFPSGVKREVIVPKFLARSITLLLVTATVVAGMTACTAGPTSGKGSVAVHAGQDAKLTAGLGEALVVTVPGSAIKGDGKLSAKPVSGPGGIAGWHVEMTGGATLVGHATLRFAHKLSPGEPAPVITSTEDGTTFQAASSVKVDGNGVVVEATHFSNWFTMWWDDLMTQARSAMDALYRGAGQAPTCTEEDKPRSAGYTVSSDSGNLVYWCLGAGAASPSLKVVNGRGYTAAAESTPGLSIDDAGPSDLIGIISNIFKDAPRGKGDTVTLVGPGATQSYTVSGTGSMGVRVRPSAGGYLVSAAQYAADTLALVLPYAGKSGLTESAVIKLFDWESCLSGYSTMTTADIQTATQASNYMSDAIGTTLGCTGGALERAGLNFFGTAFAAGLSWLIAGLRTAANGFGAAADTALNPNGYTILVTAPSPQLPGLPAQLSGKWCTRTAPQDCFSGAETLAKFPHAYVENGGPDGDGTFGYAICLEQDLDNGCTEASTESLQYYPAGVVWDCTTSMVKTNQYPKCDPDYTAEHDSSQPRLVIRPNHQQDVDFHDAPPMYRVSG